MSRAARAPRKAPPPPPVRGARRRASGEVFVLFNCQMPPEVRDALFGMAVLAGTTGSAVLLAPFYDRYPHLRPPRARPKGRRRADP